MDLLRQIKDKLKNVEYAEEFYYLLDSIDFKDFTEITYFSAESIYYSIARFILDNSVEIDLMYNMQNYDDATTLYIPTLNVDGHINYINPINVIS